MNQNKKEGRKVLFTGICIVVFCTSNVSWGDVRVGMEGVVEKRSGGDQVFLPQGWVDVSVSRFVSETYSLFGDFSAKV